MSLQDFATYWNGLAAPLLFSLIGGFMFVIRYHIRHGDLSTLKEGDAVIVLLDFGGIFAAIKIVFLSINTTTQIDTGIDRIYLIVGAFMTALITYKDLEEKFKK